MKEIKSGTDKELRGGRGQAIMHSGEVEGVSQEGKVGHSRTPYTVEQLQLKGHYLSTHTDACEKSLCDKAYILTQE